MRFIAFVPRAFYSMTKRLNNFITHEVFIKIISPQCWWLWCIKIIWSTTTTWQTRSGRDSRGIFYEFDYTPPCQNVSINREIRRKEEVGLVVESSILSIAGMKIHVLNRSILFLKIHVLISNDSLRLACEQGVFCPWPRVHQEYWHCSEIRTRNKLKYTPQPITLWVRFSFTYHELKENTHM